MRPSIFFRRHFSHDKRHAVGGLSPTSSQSAAGSTSLADYTSESLIVPELKPQNSAEVVYHLCQLLEREGRVPGAQSFCDAVMSREVLVSTAMEHGLAFPHARLNGVKKLSFALGRSARPISWDSHGGALVQLVFLIAVPDSEATNYLNLISGLARLGKGTELLQKLLAAPQTSQILSVLKEVKVRRV